MKRFYQTFKALPPEFKLVLGFLGLGTMAGLFYLLQRQLGGRTMTLIIVGVAAALVLLVWLVMRLFGWTGRRRAARMDYELSSGEQGGPQSMDVSAKIKANNEKFFKAVRELKKTVGISVYELPWYIVIGDSGCGKTKLVNEGGLTFSTGKPEGYQLGTLDYNWWFTEDAIFIDMAGRLCNPQDDRDRREWMAFLDTIARGRKGYPINGALVCVSTEHLLRDPPEKHESDAHIALERLRDLQSKLGVTFATYLVVTKCDKILGFMQFFDRAERDIAVKNQIFGWSRPGAFNEPYDPEKFKGDFSKLYGTLNDLRLRRMNDDAEEIDLGLACAFPEEFRGLFDPLQTYIRTLFPFIRNPRAVKNLLFRGVYFTSATQEGELILKHLTERLGNEAASQFPPLDDLYPHKRPHFIKDVLMRKVFPEHGLVFRNEQQVVRNRRLSRALMVGTCVLAVLLFGGFAWSIVKYDRIVGSPTIWAKGVAERFPQLTGTAPLDEAGKAETHWKDLEANRTWAQVLCGIFCDPMEPGKSLEKIRAKLVEKALKGVIGDVREALRSGSGLTGDPKAYQDALEDYIRWYGCREQEASAANVGADSFEKLTGLVKSSSPLMQDGKFASQSKWYFEEVRKKDTLLSRNPAALLAEADKEADQTIKTAVKHVSGYFARQYAAFSTDNLDEAVREWKRILDACRKADESYGTLLTTCRGADKVPTLQELDHQKEGFLGAYRSWETSLASVMSGKNMISPLADALWKQREVWKAYRDRLLDVGRACTNIGAADTWLIPLNDDNLDKPMWDSLRNAGLAAGDYNAKSYTNLDTFKACVQNVHDVYGYLLAFTPDPKSAHDGAVGLSEEAKTVQSSLNEINAEWGNAKLSGCLPVASPDSWVAVLGGHVNETPEGKDTAKPVGVKWEPKQLKALLTDCRVLVHQGVGTCLLQAMLSHLTSASDENKTWGLASLVGQSKRNEAKASAFFRISESIGSLTDTESPQPARDTPPAPAGSTGGWKPPQAKHPDPKSPRPAVGQPPRPTDSKITVRHWATPKFLFDRATDVVQLASALDQFDHGHCLPSQGGAGTSGLPEQCKSALEESMRRYMRKYVQAWNQSYQRAQLSNLKKLEQDVTDWERLAKKLKDEDNLVRDVAHESTAALQEILQSIPMATYDANGAAWAWDNDETKPDSWFRDVLRESTNWKAGEWVTALLPPTAPDGTPWDKIAQDFREAWDDLARGIKGNDELDRRMEHPESFAPIPWGRIEELRSKYALGSEKLTQELTEFEHWAGALLDARLTRFLVNAQSEFLGEVAPDPKLGGWPFRLDPRADPDLLATVQCDKFKELLKKVGEIKKGFEILEGGLGKREAPPGYKSRQAFYAACSRWQEFLKEDKVEVTVIPCSIDDTPDGKWPANIKNYCREVAVSIKLELGGRDQPDFLCESQHWGDSKKTITWNFKDLAGDWFVSINAKSEEKSSDTKDPKDPSKVIHLVEKTKRQKLGADSALALCAYLQRYGKPKDDRKTWYVVHGFDAEVGGAKPEAYGAVLRFDFGKTRLPEPIPKLEPAKTPEPPKWDDVSTGPR